MRWCSNLSELIDFLAYVSLYAPDEFPDDEEDTLDFDSAYVELEHGLQVGLPELRNEEVAQKVRDLVTQSRQLYLNGQDTEASSALIEAEYLLRGKGKRRNGVR